MIKTQSTIVETGDKLSIIDKSITIDDIEYQKDSLYVKTGEEGEILPPIYLDGENIVFNHKIDKTRRHITFVNHLGNDKRFLGINLNSLKDWSKLIIYVNYYNLTDAEQLKMLGDIRKAFKGTQKEWVAKGK